MYKLETIYRAADSPAGYVRDYFDRLQQLMQSLDAGLIERMIDMIAKTCAAGGTLYLAANGGSSAVASHFVNDAVVGAFTEGQPPLRAISLSDNVESITAIANDIGYENIFAFQIKALMKPGDLLLAMSVSGNSPNILAAVQAAQSLGGQTLGWTGFDGGKLAGCCDLSIQIPTTRDEYGPVEDMFSILEHATVTYLTMKRGRKLYH